MATQTGAPYKHADPDYAYFLRYLRLDGDSYAFDRPAVGDSPAAFVKFEPPMDGQAQIASVPASGGWAEEAHVDPDYAYFLKHLRLDGSSYVFDRPAAGDNPGGFIKFEEPLDGRFRSSSGGQAKSGRPAEKELNMAGDLHESVRRMSIEEEEETLISSGESEPDVQKSRVCDFPTNSKKGKSAAGRDKSEHAAGKDQRVGLHGSRVMVSQPDIMRASRRHVHPATRKKITVEEQFLSAPVLEHNDQLGAGPHIAPELGGVIWPAHIMKRTESNFKKGLMRTLSQPCREREYDNLVSMATLRKPLTLDRHTRRGLISYNSENKENKSYFDCYPDLAKQVESTSYPNKIALLRGFFFWLQNIAHEDQFRPWADDHTHYGVIPFMQ